MNDYIKGKVFTIICALLIYSCAEVTRIDTDPELSFPKLVRNSTNNKITSDDILKNVTGDKDGYTLKEIRNISETNLAKIQGKEIVLQKVGNFTATLVFEHSSLKDITINGAKFEWNYASSFTFNKLTKNIKTPIITTAEILGSVIGHKVGYTLKNIMNISDNDLASVLGSKPNFEINLKKVGSFTVTIVLEHSKYGEATIRLAQFECVNTVVIPTVTSKTGRIWMDRNLGANRVATAPDDQESYGDYYQFGRPKDGHQKSNSPVIYGDSATTTPPHGAFIAQIPLKLYSWYIGPIVPDLWQGGSGHTRDGGVNNPCPTGFRVPTVHEWEEEIRSWSKVKRGRRNKIWSLGIANAKQEAFSSVLKLPAAGYRGGTHGHLGDRGDRGYYYGMSKGLSLLPIGHSYILYFYDNIMPSRTYSDGNDIDKGLSIRCIKDAPNIITHHGFSYKTVTTKTGRVWLDRNLGANAVATAPDDSQAYGDYYQWGRAPDGHQMYDSPITTVKSSNTTPKHGKFIRQYQNWHSTTIVDGLWSGSGGHTPNGGANNPCPKDFRVPTMDEWEQEITTWSGVVPKGGRLGDNWLSTGSGKMLAFNSVLKLTFPGYRQGSLARIFTKNHTGHYYSSTPHSSMINNSYGFYFDDTDIRDTSIYRVHGGSVRCIRGY